VTGVPHQLWTTGKLNQGFRHLLRQLISGKLGKGATESRNTGHVTDLFPATEPTSGSSNVSNQRSTTSGNKTTRNLTLQSYDYEEGAGEENASPILLVRYPQDLKRERVQFKLTSLDLL
jgi:hypothetical protein